MPLISLVIPVYNEEESVEAAYTDLSRVMQAVDARYDYEFIFTDNHSSDSTFDILRDLATRDERIRVFRFSRNFGYQRSIKTGFLKARGDAAIQIDCDLQDPPEMIVDFLRYWEDGFRVVYGVRVGRKESFAVSLVRRIFYRFINSLSEDDLPLDAGDFRLIDRCIIDELAKTDDSQPYLRGAIAAMGFQQKGLPYQRHARLHGVSKFSFTDLVRLGLDGVLNHSIVPLRIASLCGVFVTAIVFVGAVGYIGGRVVFGADWPAGFATLTVLILAGISLNAFFLGIIGEYLGRIYLQVRSRPLTIIEHAIDPQPQNQHDSRDSETVTNNTAEDAV
jgi:polyisoprenyl-phosphate glycosyltransferase